MFRMTSDEVWSRRFRIRGGIGALIGLGLSLTLAPAADAQPARDFSKVEVTTTRLADNFYILDFGGVGAAIGVLTGPDGVLMVDDQFAPLGPKIEAAIKKISTQPIRYVINTHVHGDHNGGNEYFARLGATIVAQQQVRARMARPGTSAESASLPKMVYDRGMTLHFAGEEVRLIAVPKAHTDGDTLVYLPKADIILVGDLYRPLPYPHIDLPGGGTLQGMLDGLASIIALAGPNTKIIAGHGGPLSDRAAAIAQRDLMLKVRDRVAVLVAQGKSEDEVVAAKVTAGLDARVPQDDITVDRFVREVYKDRRAVQ